MSSFDEYKKKLQKRYVTNENSSFDDYRAKLTSKYATNKVDSSDVEAWFKDVDSALKLMQDYHKQNEGKYVAEYGGDIGKRVKDLMTSSGDIYSYLQNHKSDYANFSELNDAFSMYKSALQQHDLHNYQASRYYSQFGSEEAYNYWKKAEEERKATLGAEDFEEYYQAGKTDDDKNDFIMEIFGKPVGESNYIEHYRKVYADAPFKDGTYGGGQISANASYALAMTEDEVKIYDYYLGKYGKDRAEEYLDSIKDTLNQRIATGIYNTVDGNKFLETAFAFSAGLDQFASGIGNLDNLLRGTEADSPTVTQYASSMIREDMGGVQGVAYDLLSTTSNMLPSILVGAMTGGAGGAITLGASAVGNGYAEMRRHGYNENQARAYGVLVGASEATLQYILGGISPLGSAKGGIFSKATTAALGKVDNALARFAIEVGGNMLDEGFEEAAQGVLEPIFKRILTGANLNIDWGEVAYQGLLGALSAGVLEGAPSIASTAVNSYKAKNAYGVDAQALVTESLDIDPENAHAQRMQEWLNNGKNVSGYQLNRLVEANKKTMASQEKSKMKSAVETKLTERGETGDVGKIADVIIKAKSGEKLSRSERVILDEGKYDVEELTTAPIDEEKSSATNNTPTKEIASEGKKIVPEMKATMVDSEGETINVKPQRFVSTESGEVGIELEGGKVVAVGDVDFGDSGKGLLYQAAMDRVASGSFSIDTANVFVRGYDEASGQNVGEYVNGWLTAYNFGAMKTPPPRSILALNSTTSNLTEEQRETAYNFGKALGNEKVTKSQAKIDSTVSNKAEKDSQKTTKKGKLHNTLKPVNETQRASLKALGVLAEALDIDIYTFESPLVNGRRQGENGRYYPEQRRMDIDLYAGWSGEGTMLFTAAHELTHHIRATLPAKFNAFAEFLFEQFEDKGISVSNLIANKIEHLKANNRTKGMTEEEIYDRAYEEVVADACESFLADGEAVAKIAELKAKDKSLWQTIKDFFTKLVARIKAAYEGLSPDSVEGSRVAEMLDTAEKLKAMWTEMLVETSEVSDLVEVDTDTESVAPMFSERTWTESEYVTEREETAKKISKALGVDIKTAYKYIDDINGVARLIADDRARLDYEPNLDDNATVLKPNSEYKYTVDMSTLCAKRLLFTGTFDAIQKALPNWVFDSEDIVALREMMQKRGYEVACGICYVESTRREIGRITQEFIDRYKVAQKTGEPISRINSSGKEVVLKSAGRTFSADKNYTPNLGELNTTDIDIVKRDHREVYDAYLAFMNARGQAKPKLLETRAEYKGEILKHFKAKSAVEARNNAGGLRLQSFSDFEVPHMIDMMQIVMDMARVGLKSQAYTKVPAFAEIFGDTGVKINLSLIAKGDGLDSNGNLIFDDVEGINHKEAFKLRDKYSKNVGTILVGKTDAHIIAAMADPRIDFIIPFHKSSWKESLYDALGLTGYADYTETQNEKPIDKNRKIKNFDPSEYWDFTKSGDENAQIYLEKCREDGRIPKFPQFQGYPGYWKLLIDFKMYDNDGVGSPQEVVNPIFNTEASERILGEYKGGHRNFPVAKDVVEDFVKEHKDKVKYSDRDSLGNELSKEQVEFFKDSKVRDKKGNLMVLYHGTTAKFNTFKKGDVGFHFGTKGAARGRVGFGKNVTLKEVYLNITNPIVFDEDLGSWDADHELTRELYDRGVLTQAEAESVLFTDDRQYRRNTESANKKLASVLLEKGYDGIAYSNTFETKKATTSYIVFNSNQAKETSNKTPTSNPDIRYSDRQAEIANRYTYEKLTSKPDMTVALVNESIKYNRADIVYHALKNAASVGYTNQNGNAVVRVDDIDTDVIVPKRSLVHGLDRRIQTQAPVLVKIGDILKNSIRINELIPRADEVKNSYVLIGAARNRDGHLYIASFVVNRYSNEVMEIDVLYSANAKKESAAFLPKITDKSATPTNSAISIAQLLDFVNRYFPDILPESVLRHYGYNARPEGKIGESALYSDRNTASFKGKPFWSGSVSLLDGVIEEVHSFNEAESADFHHSMYFSSAQIEKMENEENAFFFVENGEVQGDWRVSIPDDIIERIKEQIVFAPSNPEAREFSDADIKYSIRAEAPPKKTIEGYKVFVVKNGKLYPPMVANPNAEDTPVGVWLNADVGTRAPDSKMGRMQVKAGGKGTQGGSGSLAFRPGWHLGETPLATQFDRTNPETGVKELFPENFVWALCDIAADHDYQEEAMSYGYTKNGKFQHSLAGLPKLPTDGYYKYRTNPNPDTVPWLITGAMKVKRLLSDAEVNAILAEKGLPPKKRVGGDKTLADLGLSQYEGKLFSDRNPDSVSNRSLLANALESVAQNDIERNKLTEYKSKIALIDSEQVKLAEIRAKIKELSFAKGKRDTEAIKKLQFEEKQTANRINTYDKQLLSLESTKALKGVLEREKKMAYKRAEQKGKEALEAYRERAAKTQRELLTRYQESRKKGVENRNKTAMRHKIKDVVNELNQYLLKGTKEKHVPIELQKAVAEALDAVNMDTVSADERIAKKREEMMKAKTPEAIEKLAKEIEHIQEMGGNMANKISRLKTAYDSIINSDDPLIANSHDDVIANTIDKVIEVVGDTPLRDMSLYQLEAVYDMYRMVLHSIRSANKAFKAAKGEEISIIANGVIAELEDQKRKSPYVIKALDKLSEFDWNNLKPVYAFERIGSANFTKVFNEVRAGEDVWAKDMSEAQAFREEQFKQFNYNSWDFKKRYGFTSTSGIRFELSLDQILSLYAFSKRKQAGDHLRYGGFVFDGLTEVKAKNKAGVTVTYQLKDATAYNLSEETLGAIIGTLTPEQKAFADAMQDYLSTVMGEKGNEVSLALYDIKLFKEKYYFPLKSAPQYMAKAKEQAQGEVKIKNYGFTKETDPKAKNPIVLSSFMDVWASHVNEMSMYHAFTLPLEDFYRVYNYHTPADENMSEMSVGASLENAHGRASVKYIDQLLKDLNGGARVDSTTGIINKLTGLFKKSAVFASVSVVVQQPSAIARATALVDTKYFVDKPSKSKHKETWAEVKKYAPVAIIKEMGYFDTGMGKSSVEWLKGEKTFKDKLDDAASFAPGLADELAWCAIWNAVKRETLHTYKHLKPNSEAFLKVVGERFTEVITKTQVYDSVLSRSANMRSKDTGMKMATAFMAEPTTSINMLENALIQGKRGNKRYARKAVGSVVASMILNSILVSFVYAGRDDDEDKTYTEKYIGTLTEELIDGFNPLTLIPFAKDIVSIVQGYDVERSDMAVITDIIKAWNNLESDNRSAYRKVEDFAGAIASIFGLPVKNIMRDARGMYNTINSFINGQQTTGAGIKNALTEAVTGDAKSNGQQLYEAMLKGDTAQIERVKGRFKDQNAINSAIRKALRDNDPRIKQAAEARYNGNIAEYMRIAKEIIAEGHFKQDDIVSAINSEISALKKGEGTTESSAPDKATSIYKMDDYYAALVGRDQATAYAVKEDLIETDVANGKDREEAEADFNSRFASHLRELYEDGELSDYDARNMLVNYAGKSEEDAYSKVQYWEFKQMYPDYDLSEEAVKKYYNEVEPSGIGVDVYYDYSKQRAKCKGVDANGDGKTDSGSVKWEVMQVINSLPITYAQKDALYYLNGWSASTIWEAPWH